MGIDWMNRDEMCQAIPPAYTEWLGRYAMAHTANAAGEPRGALAPRSAPAACSQSDSEGGQ